MRKPKPGDVNPYCEFVDDTQRREALTVLQVNLTIRKVVIVAGVVILGLHGDIQSAWRVLVLMLTP